MRLVRTLFSRRVLVSCGALGAAWVAAGAPVYFGM